MFAEAEFEEDLFGDAFADSGEGKMNGDLGRYFEIGANIEGVAESFDIVPVFEREILEAGSG